MTLPPPITELSMEHRFEIAKIMRDCRQATNEALLEAIEATLEQNYLLKATVVQLVSEWPYGIDEGGEEADSELA